MTGLQAWLKEQFDQKRVEPNSSLGKAITYLLNHWEPLTLFLRVAGAGDLRMGLSYTCRLNSVNPFHYLTELLRHQDAIQLSPDAWLPWSYKAALGGPSNSG